MLRSNRIIPSLFAPDLDTTIKFYVDVLGFRDNGAWQDDGERIWGEVAYGDTSIWFFSRAIEGFPQSIFSGLLYLFVDDVDAVAKNVEGKIDFLWGPENQEYGVRELGIKDNNGYMIVFAEDV